MARHPEEQQPLTATGSARTSEAEVPASYGAAAEAAAPRPAAPADAASDAVAAAVAAAAENGAGNGFCGVHGEEGEVEAGQRGLLGASNGAAAPAGSTSRGSQKEGSPACCAGEKRESTSHACNTESLKRREAHAPHRGENK